MAKGRDAACGKGFTAFALREGQLPAGVDPRLIICASVQLCVVFSLEQPEITLPQVGNDGLFRAGLEETCGLLAALHGADKHPLDGGICPCLQLCDAL